MTLADFLGFVDYKRQFIEIYSMEKNDIAIPPCLLSKISNSVYGSMFMELLPYDIKRVESRLAAIRRENNTVLRITVADKVK